MNMPKKLPVALLALSLALSPLLALPASAQGISFGLTCPIAGGTCEATPQLPGYTYFFQGNGNAFISIPSPASSLAAFVSCQSVLPYTGSVSVVIFDPNGQQQASLTTGACPAQGPDDGGPVWIY